MTEERKNAIASLKEELAKNDGYSYKFKIKGHPYKECALFYNGKKVYTADKLFRVRDFVFDVFDHSPTVVGKWDYYGSKNAELAEKSETEFVFYKDDLRIAADNVQEIVKECKHESVFSITPFEDDEETNCSRDTTEMWHCESVHHQNVFFPVADLERETVVPTLASAFEKADIRFGETSRDLLEYMVAHWIPFKLTVFHHGVNITVDGLID